MSKVLLAGNEINTIGNLPEIGAIAPNFTLVNNDLEDISLSNFKGQKVILNIFPSVDTPICATSVRKFNEEASLLENTKVLCISADLPFAFGRFCGAEGIENVETLSIFRDNNFGENYGNLIIDSPLKGVLARSIIIIDEDGKVCYTELVKEIQIEPNYEKALNSIK